MLENEITCKHNTKDTFVFFILRDFIRNWLSDASWVWNKVNLWIKTVPCFRHINLLCKLSVRRSSCACANIFSLETFYVRYFSDVNEYMQINKGLTSQKLETFLTMNIYFRHFRLKLDNFASETYFRCY